MDFRRFVRAEWDRIAGYGFLLAGAVALLFGFLGVRNAADVIDEISYLVTGGIGAIFLLGVGATLLLSADLHDDFRKLHRVEEKLDAIHQVLLAEHPELVDLTTEQPRDSGPNGAAAVSAPPVAQKQPAGAASGSGSVGASAAASAGPALTAASAGDGPRPPLNTPGSGVLAVKRGRRVATIGVLGAAVLFLAGAIATANQASTDRLAGGVAVALSGALLAAVTAGLLVGQLKGLLEQRQAVALGPWLGTGVPALPTSATEERRRSGRTGSDAAPASSSAPGPWSGSGSGSGSASGSWSGSGSAAQVWVVDGLSLYHRAGCRALEGRPAVAADRAALASGVRPCGLCEPPHGG